MDPLTIGFLITSVILMILAIKKDKKKTLTAMTLSRSMMKNMVGNIISILFLIGLVLAYMPPTTIETYLGSASNVTAAFYSAILGSITLIPGFVAFPLVGSLVDSGASILSATAFLTTLTMVGTVTIPLEKKEFGLKFTLYRNLISFVFAIIIAIFMEVLV